MAFVGEIQEIPSEWYQYAIDVGVLRRANGNVQKKYPESIKHPLTWNQRWTWDIFLKSVCCWRLQPLVGGVEPPRIGPRSRSWWYARGWDFPVGYYNYFMKHTLNLYYADQVPTWCIPPYLYIGDTHNSRIVFYNPDTLTYIDQVGSPGYGDKQFFKPESVAGDGFYFYVADTENHRIVKWSSLDLSFVAKIGTEGSGDDQFIGPDGITCDETYLYITDTRNDRIKKHLKSDLSFVAEYGEEGSEDWMFDHPTGITCDDEYLYICDPGNHRIKKHRKSDLEFISMTGAEGSGDDEFNHPGGITNDDRYLYISDSDNHRIKKHLKWSLAFVAETGVQGPGDNNFNYPVDITCDDIYFYLADTGNHRIKKHLKSDLSFVAKAGTYGSAFDQFNTPIGAHVYNWLVAPTFSGTFVALAAPNKNYALNEWLRVLVRNRYGSLRLWRTYLKINIEGPYTLHLHAANIWDTTGQARTLDIYEIDPADFKINTVTWNNQPETTRLIKTIFISPGTNKWIEIEIDHSKALCIRYTDESLPPLDKRAESLFCSSRRAIEDLRPYVTV